MPFNIGFQKDDLINIVVLLTPEYRDQLLSLYQNNSMKQIDEYPDQARLKNEIFTQYLSTRQLATMNLAYQRDVTKKKTSNESNDSTKIENQDATDLFR